MTSPEAFGGEDHAGFEEEYFCEPHDVPQNHEEHQLIKDGNALIQQNLEARKNSRESYARGQNQASKKKPDLNKSNNLSLVDWSGFPAAAHSPGHAAERKRASSFRKANKEAENGKQEKKPSSFRNRRLANLDANKQVSPKGPTGRQGSDDRQRRRASLGSVPTKQDDAVSADGRRAKYRNRRHSQRNLNANPPPPPPSEVHQRGRNSRPPRRFSNPKQPVSPKSRVRRPVAAAASSTTLEVSRKPPQRSTSGRRRVADDGGTSAFGGERRRKGSFTW